MIGNILYEQISKAWPESYHALSGGTTPSNISYFIITDNIGNLIIILGISVFLIMALGRIISGFLSVSVAGFSSKKLLNIEREINLKTNKDTLLLFSVLCCSFFGATTIQKIGTDLPFGDSIWKLFIAIFGIITAFVMFKMLILDILTWVNKNRFFKFFKRIFFTYLAFILSLSLLGLIVFTFSNLNNIQLLSSYLLMIFFIGFLLYLYQGYRLIIDNGVSPFGGILYLCTLEILPIALLAHIIFS